jgi:hypothetical protein
MSNDEVIRDGLLQAKREVESYLLTKMQGTPMRFPDMALVNKPYAGFTGNAQTSYAVALYENGVMLMRHSTGDNTRKPIRLKIGYGKRVHLKNPFEGAERTVTGKTQLYTKTGEEAVNLIFAMPRTMSSMLMLRYAVGVEYDPFIGNPIGRMRLLAGSLLGNILK